jgi:hypothetical protein
MLAVEVAIVEVEGVRPSLENRYRNIEDWLAWGEERYTDLISRATETAGSAGWDSEPRQRPCECRIEWRRGSLCLQCDNTRFRRCDKDDPRAVDLYALGVSAVKGGFSAASAGDESTAQKHAASIARISSILASLERTRLQREGVEAEPDKSMRELISLVGDTLDRAPRQYRVITRAVHDLNARYPRLGAQLPGRVGIIALSVLIPGKITPKRS